MSIVDWSGNGNWIPEISFHQSTGEWTVVLAHRVPGVVPRTITGTSPESVMEELARILRSDLDD